MAKYTVDEAVDIVGSRFDLILMAAERAREIEHGSPVRVDTKSKSVSAALEEIEAGLYTKEEYLLKLRNKKEY